MAIEHPNHTQVQVYKATHQRIRTLAEKETKTSGRRVSANDVIVKALDALEQKQ